MIEQHLFLSCTLVFTFNLSYRYRGTYDLLLQAFIVIICHIHTFADEERTIIRQLLGGSLVAQQLKTLLQCNRSQFDTWAGKICWRRGSLLTPVFLGFPGSSAGKESTCNSGDLGSTPGWGRSPWEWNSYLLQYSGLENSMYCIVHGVANIQTQLRNFHFAQTTQPYFTGLSTIYTTYSKHMVTQST